MKESTGEIRPYEDIPEAERKKWIPIPEEKLAEVQRMNRKDRRRWAKLQRQSDINGKGKRRNGT